MTKAMPLAGVRVVELGHLLAAPLCGQILADFGAEVIKIERPGRGDEFRTYGPPFARGANGEEIVGLSPSFLGANRNKKSVAIDFTKPKGRDLVRRIVRDSQVVIENYRTGVLARHGLGFDDLRKDNPGLVYMAITGFGQAGPYAQRPGTDGIFQAMSGLMSATGEPGGPPVKVGTIIADFMAGLYGAIGVLIALRGSEKYGAGQAIDLALLDACVNAMTPRLTPYLMSGQPPGAGGGAIGPIRQFTCADGRNLYLQASDDPVFIRLCGALGQPALAADPRFADRRARGANAAALDAILEPAFAARPRAEWLDRMAEADVLCAPVYTVEEMLADPHVRQRGLIVERGAEGNLPTPLVANPLRLSATPSEIRTFPPRLGADTEAVLAGLLGLGDDARQALRAEGVIQEADPR